MRLLPDSIQPDGYYTFKGTKLMFSGCFDIKGIIPMDFLGAEDLKLYTEAAILGVKDYPMWYNSLSRRIPVMAGFNMPTWKLLDVFAVELEYYSSRLPTDRNAQQYNGYAVPITKAAKYDPGKYIDDDVKWSVYFKRTFYRRLGIVGQLASDHTRAINSKGINYFGDMYRSAEQWYWMMKVESYF